jgi:hypothetical protein
MCVGSKAGSVWALFATHGKPLITSHQCVTAECQIHLLLTDQVCGNGSGIPYVLFASVFRVLHLLPVCTMDMCLEIC